MTLIEEDAEMAVELTTNAIDDEFPTIDNVSRMTIEYACKVPFVDRIDSLALIEEKPTVRQTLLLRV